MTETRTFLLGVTVAIAVAIPLAALHAVLFYDEDEGDEPCCGCGEHGCAGDAGLQETEGE